MVERTFAIIKPDATQAKYTGPIIDLIELNKFNIVRMQKLELSTAQVEEFYAVHRERSFFKELVDYMLSGPVTIMALEKENAVNDWRKLMGATNPAEAEVGTIRKMFGKNIGNNAVHGSDSAQTAKSELNFFFPDLR